MAGGGLKTFVELVSVFSGAGAGLGALLGLLRREFGETDVELGEWTGVGAAVGAVVGSGVAVVLSV